MAVTASYEILPEFREYERTLTTVMNSYVQPRMDPVSGRHAAKAETGQAYRFMEIVRSDGGVMSMKAASNSPSPRLLSGLPVERWRQRTSANCPDSPTFCHSTWVAPPRTWLCPDRSALGHSRNASRPVSRKGRER